MELRAANKSRPANQKQLSILFFLKPMPDNVFTNELKMLEKSRLDLKYESCFI